MGKETDNLGSGLFEVTETNISGSFAEVHARTPKRVAKAMGKLRNWVHASIGKGPEAAKYLEGMREYGSMAQTPKEGVRLVYRNASSSEDRQKDGSQ